MTIRKASQGQRAASPLCLRVTAEERRLLEAGSRAWRQPSVSAYIRARMFGGQSADAEGPAVSGRVSPIERQRLLAQILGALGGSKALGNLSDLADAARIGALPVTPDVVRDIRTACAAVVDLRNILLRALGTRRVEGEHHDR